MCVYTDFLIQFKTFCPVNANDEARQPVRKSQSTLTKNSVIALYWETAQSENFSANSQLMTLHLCDGMLIITALYFVCQRGRHSVISLAAS